MDKLDAFSRCECDYLLFEHEGKYIIKWCWWSQGDEDIVIYEDEKIARKDFEKLRNKETDYWELKGIDKEDYNNKVNEEIRKIIFGED